MQRTIPAQNPDLATAAKCSQKYVFLRSYICLAVPLPGKVPFFLPTHTDCSAVYNILQIGRYAAQKKKTEVTNLQWAFCVILKYLTTSLKHKALHCVDIQKAALSSIADSVNTILIHRYFYPEDGCSMFFLNISSRLQDYMVLQPRR
jgi:hypothetical protein